MKNLFTIFNKKNTSEKHVVSKTATGDSGINDTEYSQETIIKELDGIAGINNLNLMSLNSQVAMVLSALKNPIMAANWNIFYENTEKENKEIKELIEFYFFEKKGGFSSILFTSLEFLTYGFSIFEKVYKTKEFKKKEYLLPDLQPRVQASIEDFDNENKFLVQNKKDGSNVEIPYNNLLIFTFNKKGDDIRGQSILRNSYKEYKRLENTEILDEYGVRKAALGIPSLQVPKSMDSEGIDFKKIVSNLTKLGSSKNPFFIYETPNKFEILKFDYNSSAVNEKIQRHQKQIAKSVLIQFLELGMTGSGSYALSDTQAQLFLNSLNHISNLLEDCFNDLIREMVIVNFGEQDYYPKIKAVDINKTKIEQQFQIISTLYQLGVLNKTNEDELFLRDKFGLPANIEATANEETNTEATANEEKSFIINKKANSKIDITKRNKEINDETKILQEVIRQELFKANKKIGDKLLRQMNDGTINTSGLASVNVEAEAKELKSVLSDNMANYVIIGLENAKDIEKRHIAKKGISSSHYFKINHKVNTNKLPKRLNIFISNKSRIIAEKQTIEIKFSLVNITQRNLDTGAAIETSIANAVSETDNIINNKNLFVVADNIITSSSNNGEQDYYLNQSKLGVQAFEFTAVDDGATTQLCLELNGSIIKENSSSFTKYSPPLHYGCRSVLAPIYTDEPKAIPSKINLTKAAEDEIKFV